MESTQKSQPSALRKLGYTSAVIGGGVVGADYATWMQVDPMVGAAMGSAISTVLTKILFHLQDDPGSKILNFLMGLGMLLGAVAGTYFGFQIGMAENEKSVLIYSGSGLAGGAFCGALVGKVVAGLISFSAFMLLFVSRGPVGLFLRNTLTSQPNADESSQTENTFGMLGDILDEFFALVV